MPDEPCKECGLVGKHTKTCTIFIAEINEALKSLAAKGFMVDNGDGTFTPTALGRMVAKQSGGKN